MAKIWVIGKVERVGIPAGRNRPSPDLGAVFIEMCGRSRETVYGRVDHFDGKVEVGALVLFEISEKDGRERVRPGSGRVLLPSTDFGSIDKEFTSAMSQISLSTGEASRILALLPEPFVLEWWSRHRERFEGHESVVSAMAGIIPGGDPDDPTFGYRPEEVPAAATLEEWGVDYGIQLLRHRAGRGWDYPDVESLGTDFLTEMLKAPFSPEVQIRAFRALSNLLDEDEITELVARNAQHSTALEAEMTAWAATMALPPDHRLFGHSRLDSFLAVVASLPDDVARGQVRARINNGTLSLEDIPRDMAWSISAPPVSWGKHPEEAARYVDLASEFCETSDLNNVVSAISHLVVEPSANDANSSLSAAVERLALRLADLPGAPAWFGSYPRPGHDWGEMTTQQQMFRVIREHAHGIPSSMSIPRTSLNELVKIVLYLCEYSAVDSKWERNGIYDNLRKAVDLIGKYSDECIDQGQPLDMSPLLPGCNVDDLRVSKIAHCEGRFAMEAGEVNGIEKWVRVEPQYCRCPRTRSACGVDNGVEPNTDKSWWNWSMTELLAQAGVDYARVAATFGIEAADGDLFVTRLGGIANRVAELQEILRCRSCNRHLRFQMKYSVNPAYYMATTTHPCEGGTDTCDKSVYASHCRGCGRFIDNRDSRIQDAPPARPGEPYRGRGYFICIDCGTGSSKEEAGKICPSCGARHSMGGVGRDRTCRQCRHQISLPWRN